MPYALALDSGGALYAGGFGIGKWNGNAWSWLGSMNGNVNALAFDAYGNLCVGGGFDMVGANAAGYIVKALLSKSSSNLAVSKLGTGMKLITGQGTPGYAYALDLATNLAPPINWIPQATNNLTTQSLLFSNTVTFPRGFYRARYVDQ